MRIHRVVLVALLIGIGPVVAGCADGFDMDKLDVFNLNKKKPLPGDVPLVAAPAANRGDDEHAAGDDQAAIALPDLGQPLAPDFLVDLMKDIGHAALPVRRAAVFGPPRRLSVGQPCGTGKARAASL